MKKKFFLQFDCYGKNFNKFYYNVVEINLDNIGLRDFCIKVINEVFEIDMIAAGVTTDDLVIKVNQLNNIDT